MSSRNKRGGRRKSPVSKNSRSGKMPRDALRFYTCLLLSLLIHLLPLIFLALGSGNGGEGEGTGKGGARQEDQVDIVPLSELTPVEEAVPDEFEYRKTCEPYYGGIGVVHNGLIVTEVPRGYPAHELGIQLGDMLLNSEELKGPVGTPVTIKLLRLNETLTFHTTRARICVKDTKTDALPDKIFDK